MSETQSSLLGRTKRYLEEVQGEFHKITWPPQLETVNGTLSVVVIVSLVAAFLGVVDFALSRVMQQVLG